MEVAKNRLLKEKLIQDLSIDFIDINKDNEPCFEMELMRNCNHFIVSGGGFSNLATVLGKHKNKIIIRPTHEDYFIDKEKEWHYKYNNGQGVEII
jgi:hypothetical protein